MRIFLCTLIIALAACGNGAGYAGAPDAAGPGQSRLEIYDVQGAGTISPLEGEIVAVDGVVTGDFQAGDADAGRNLGGFFLQALVTDGDSSTSDGIFVYDGERPAIDISIGDRVSVEGTVTEFFGETQIRASLVRVAGTGNIDPVAITLPAATVTRNADGTLIADLERYEGMLIRLPQTMTVGSLYRLERFGEVTLIKDGRRYQYTVLNPPNVEGYAAHVSAHAAASLLLDDGRRQANAVPVPYLTAADDPNYALRVGDEVAGLIGNLRYSRGSGSAGTEAFRLMPVADVNFQSRNPRPALPAVDGGLTIAYFNAQNFFATLDNGSAICGPGKGAGCRGADTAAEFNRHAAKLVTALRLLDADIFGLVEVENDGGESLRLLVEKLNGAGSNAYQHVQTGVIGTDSITSALVYNTATIAAVGEPSVLDSSIDSRFNTRRNRPAVAQTFRQIGNGALFTVVINHLKSKGSSCKDLGDPDIGDGQGNCARTRAQAAAALADWVADDPTGSSDPDFLLFGDFNSQPLEHPLTVLEAAGYVRLLEDVSGPAAYSYVFNAHAGTLDHALVSPELLSQVTDIKTWHINADEPPVLDYNLDFDRDPLLFDPETPYRSSDHDPIIIGLDLIR